MSTVNSFLEFVNEKLVYNRMLNPNFWQNGKFDPLVRTKLVQIANDFYTDLKLKIPVIDVHLTGSMANYTWSDQSDLDVHVIIDFGSVDENTDLVKEALNGKRFIWNLRHPVVLKGHDVELYIQDDGEPHFSSGIYSLLKDEWVVEPIWKAPKVDTIYVAKKVEAFKHEIEEIEKMVKDPDLESEDARFLTARVAVLKHKIMKARNIGLEREGEFAVENLVFKELRSEGYIERLIDAGSESYAEIYSDEKDRKKVSIVKEFNDFLLENLSDQESEDFTDDIETIKQMIAIGALKPDQVKQARLKNLRVNQEVSKAKETEEYKELLRRGWIDVSTSMQLYNGTIVFSTKTAARISDYYTGVLRPPIAIAIYSSGNIRRLYSGDRPYGMSYIDEYGVDMYKRAFRLLLNNIDVNDPNLKTVPKKFRKEIVSNIIPYKNRRRPLK